MPYKYSLPGLRLTQLFEGCRFVAYQDQAGVWTIGYGHTKGVKQGDVCLQSQATDWLLLDVREAVGVVNKLVKVKLTQGQFNALVDFCFNLGQGNFAKSTLLKKVNAEDFDGAAEEFEKWDLVAGLHNKGVMRRRVAEKDMFNDKGVV